MLTGSLVSNGLIIGADSDGSRNLRPEFRGADALLVDFFDAVEKACRTEGVAFDFTDEDEWEDQHDEDEPDSAP